MRTRTVKGKAATIFASDAANEIVEWLKAQDPDELLSTAKQVKDRFARHRVTEVHTPYGEFLLKRYPRRLRASKALRELKRGMVLSEHGIPCVPPVAVVRTSKYDFVLTPYRRELISGINLVWGGLWEKLCPERRRLVIETVAKLTAALHNAGFVHGDLNSSNILFESLFEGKMRAYIIDLGSVRARKSLPAKAKDVARLWRSTRRIISNKEALRFLLLYSAATRQNCRRLLRSVVDRVKWLDKKRPIRD